MSRLGIDTGRTALLLLDLQNYNVHPDGYWASVTPGFGGASRSLLGKDGRGTRRGKSRRIAVVHVQNTWREGHPDINPHTPWQVEARSVARSTEGTWGVDFFAPVAPVEGEFVVRKRAVSAFVGTELERLLHVRDLSTLALAGGITNFAVEGTARDASDRGYRVIVLEDCCETVSDGWQAFSMTQILPLFGSVVTTDEFMEALRL